MSIHIRKNASLSLRERCEAFLSSLQASGYIILEETQTTSTVQSQRPNSSISNTPKQESLTSSLSNSNTPKQESPKSPSSEAPKSSKPMSVERQHPVLYKWPSTANNVITPATIYRCPTSGSLVPVYRRDDCSSYFVTPCDGPVPGVPVIDDNLKFLTEVCKIQFLFKVHHLKETDGSISTGFRAPPPSPRDESPSPTPLSTEDSGENPPSSSKEESSVSPTPTSKKESSFSSTSTSENYAKEEHASATESQVDEEKFKPGTEAKDEDLSATEPGGTTSKDATDFLYNFFVAQTENPSALGSGGITSNGATDISFKGCSFCRSNGESEYIVNSHILMTRERDVICPYLSKYVCPRCNATGKKAHTVKYCPQRTKSQRLQDRKNYPRWVRTSVGKYKISHY